MIPPTFQIGDEVLITGPSCSGRRTLIGGKYKIKEVTHEGNYILDCFGYYPASSLQLVELELKIGDWVEVLVDGCGKKKGFIFCIEYIKDETYSSGPIRYYSANKLPMWPKDELRKLTPEEIKQHTRKPEILDELAKIVVRLQDDAKTARPWIDGIEGRLSAIEKRLDFIEKFQREQAEYRRNMLWMAGP